MQQQKKKLLHIVEAMGGGVFTYIVELSKKLVDTYDLYILYCVREQTPSNFMDYFDPRITLIKSEHMARSINPVEDLKAFSEIRQVVSRIKPDIIHLHSSKSGVVGRWALNGKKRPTYYTPHGYSFLMEGESTLKVLIYKAIEKVCAMRNCKIISCSAGEHKESLKLTKNATFVSNGIDIQFLQPYLEPKEQEEFSIFTLGRICYQKNPNLFNKVALAMPETKFIWIGDGELRDELTAPNIEIIGWTQRDEALKIAQKSKVFMLTSLWEGLPISLLESMYMKKYCVVSNVIGNNDVIHSGENGYVCNEVQDFVNAINDIKNNNNTNLTQNAHNDVLKEYNTDVMAKKYIEIYES